MSSFGTIARRLARNTPADLVRPFCRPAALFFHGVERRADDPLVRLNHHDIDTFHAMAWSLKRNFDVLPLSELKDVLMHPAKHRRTVFLMADDGYANTLYAADVLHDLRLPWTLFVSTHHIESGERHPMFLVRLFFRFAPVGSYEIPHLGTIVLGAPKERELPADRAVESMKLLGPVGAGEALDAMMSHFSLAARAELFNRFPSDSFLTWEQLRELSNRGVEIGAHAHSHWPMNASRSADELAREALTARNLIEIEVGPCRYFAYPFGNTDDISTEAWKAVRDAGFEFAFTTLAGSLDASTNPFLMPRYGLGPEDRDLSSIVPLLRAGNRRLREFQARVSDDRTIPAQHPPFPLKQTARQS